MPLLGVTNVPENVSFTRMSSVPVQKKLDKFSSDNCKFHALLFSPFDHTLQIFFNLEYIDLGAFGLCG